MPDEDTRPAPSSATLANLGPEFNAAREHLRATVLDVISDGMHDGDALKCMATVATALLGQAMIDRDRLAAEVKRLSARVDQAEVALCTRLNCTPEELAAGFELGDAPGSAADPDQNRAGS